MSTLKVNNILSQQGTGNVAISFGTDDSVTFTNPVSQPGAFMFRNKIINGNFNIWQRATSQTSSGYGSADRWDCINSGSTKTASRQAFTLGQTDVPGNPKYFMRHVVTSSAGSGNYVAIRQKIEDVSTFSSSSITVSFWAKADSNKNIAIEFQQSFGTGGSPSTSVDSIGAKLVSLTTSWTKYTATITIPSISGKTLGTDSNDWVGIYFWFDAGSSFNSRSASLGQQSGTFDIAQVQVEEGSVATPFEQRPIGMELSLCQRYFEIASITSGGGGDSKYSATATAGMWNSAHSFAVIKRVSPSITVSGSITYLRADSLTVSGSSVSGCCTRVSSNAAGVYRGSGGTLLIDAEL
jgi:hypothetical protein